jgi:hypothetical protein
MLLILGVKKADTFVGVSFYLVILKLVSIEFLAYAHGLSYGVSLYCINTASWRFECGVYLLPRLWADYSGR